MSSFPSLQFDVDELMKHPEQEHKAAKLLFSSAAKEPITFLEQIIDFYTPDFITILDENQRGLAHVAAARGRIDILILLKEYFGSDILEIEDVNGTQPIHSAAYNGHMDVVSYLSIESTHGVLTLEAETPYGMTPAIYAGVGSKSDVLRFIAENGPSGLANLQRETKRGTIQYWCSDEKEGLCSLHVAVEKPGKREFWTDRLY